MEGCQVQGEGQEMEGKAEQSKLGPVRLELNGTNRTEFNSA